VPILNKLPFYQERDFLTFVADMCDIALTIGGCLMCVFIRNVWKIENMHEELAIGNPGYLSSFLKRYIQFMITWVCPIILGIMSVLIIIDKFFGLANLF